MAKIKIKNFGPIKEGYQENDGWIDIKKVTVFIGNQGSGKSTVAKLIASLSYAEKAMVKGTLPPGKWKTHNRFLKHISYHRLENYIYPNTEIEYKGNAYDFQFTEGRYSDNKATTNGYSLPKIMYVPSERNFVAAIEGAEKVKYLPASLVTFQDEYKRALSRYKGPLSLPINNTNLEMISGIPFIAGENYHIPLSEASSGFQASVPLYLVSRDLAQTVKEGSDLSKRELSSDEMKKLRMEIERILFNENLAQEVKEESLNILSSKIKIESFMNIVEEPEQNLFPTSQKNILESLLEFNNIMPGNKLVMTTHSPYLINYLTLAVKAEMVKSQLNSDVAKSKLAKIVPLDSTLKAEDLVIYEMNEKNGTIRKLENYRGLPSDENYLNKSLEDSNELFAQIQEIEKGWL